MRDPRIATVLAAMLVFPAFATPLRAQGESSVHVCVAADHVLRYRADSACPAGQTSYNLALDSGQPTPPDEDKTLEREIGELKKTIDFLRERVSNLEKESGKQDKNESDVGHIIRAPFHVVDKSGKAIFTVTDDAAGQAIGRVRIGRGSGDNYGIWVATAAGTPVAVISETKEGAGAVSAYDQAGKRRFQANGNGGVSLFNASGKEVGTLGLSANDPERGFLQLAGVFQIFDDAGQTMVEAGTSRSKGVGVVRVGPGATCVPMGTLRVPDCIMGRKQ